MFRPIITEPVVFQITLVIAILLAVSVWQRLKIASGIVIAVYAIYMISFVSANTKLKTSKPIKLAVHANKTIDDPMENKTTSSSIEERIENGESTQDDYANLDVEDKRRQKPVINKLLKVIDNLQMMFAEGVVIVGL